MDNALSQTYPLSPERWRENKEALDESRKKLEQLTYRSLLEKAKPGGADGARQLSEEVDSFSDQSSSSSHLTKSCVSSVSKLNHLSPAKKVFLSWVLEGHAQRTAAVEHKNLEIYEKKYPDILRQFKESKP